MEALAPISNHLLRLTPAAHPSPRSKPFPLIKRLNSIQNRRPKATFAAIADASQLAADPAQVQVTWQIVVGAVAGATPFVVAGIEFSKRIMAQKRCEECGGSGLVMRDDDYVRCPQCGGFLPWQSWRRFFWG